mmetsp:Transcript_99015/g.236270  ORF Transcript_99015/g.236270 Transcript_99015/m.236270 type:complete len:244 (-) Transcript_99015:46-777(-)
MAHGQRGVAVAAVVVQHQGPDAVLVPVHEGVLPVRGLGAPQDPGIPPGTVHEVAGGAVLHGIEGCVRHGIVGIKVPLQLVVQVIDGQEEEPVLREFARQALETHLVLVLAGAELLPQNVRLANRPGRALLVPPELLVDSALDFHRAVGGLFAQRAHVEAVLAGQAALQVGVASCQGVKLGARLHVLLVAKHRVVLVSHHIPIAEAFMVGSCAQNPEAAGRQDPPRKSHWHGRSQWRGIQRLRA